MKKVELMLVKVDEEKYLVMSSVKDDMNELTGFIGKTHKEAAEKTKKWLDENGYEVGNIRVAICQKDMEDFILKHAGLSKRF